MRVLGESGNVGVPTVSDGIFTTVVPSTSVPIGRTDLTEGSNAEFPGPLTSSVACGLGRASAKVGRAARSQM